MTWIQPPGYVHVMMHNTWQTNGLNATVSSGAPARPKSKCDHYAFWTDHGCRTWSLGIQPCKITHEAIATLHKRTSGTDEFTLVGKGEYCMNEPADFQDGPKATATDEACKQHCLRGDKGGKTPAKVGVSASAQQSDDKATVVVRLSNTASTAATVAVTLSGAEFALGSTIETWTLSAKDELAANTPSNPTNVSPVKGSSTLGLPLTVPPFSAVVLVVSK